MPTLLLATLLAAGPVLHVQAGAALGGDGSADRPFAKVSDALAHAPDGAELDLEPGLYEESLELERAATVVGRGKVVLAAPPGAAFAIANRASLRLVGLTVQGGRVGLDAEAPLELVDVRVTGQAETALACGERCVLSRTRFESTFPSAVGLRGPGAIAVHQVELSGPFRRVADLDRSSLTGEGLTIRGAVTGLQLENASADLQDVSIEGLRGACLFASGGELRLRDAEFTGCEVAVELRGGAKVELERVDVARCLRAAVTSVQSHLEVHDSVFIGPFRDGALVLMGGDSRIDQVLVRQTGEDAILARLAQVELRHFTVLGARKDSHGDFGNAIFSFDSNLTGQGLLARGCEGPALEVQLGSGRLSDVEVEQGGDAAVALEHAARLDLDGLLGTGGSGAGVACIEGAHSLLRAPSLRGFAGGAWLVDCSCQVSASPKDPALLTCSPPR